MKKRIRKFVAIMAIVLAFCFALTACGGGAANSGNSSTSESTSSSGTGKVSITFSCGESLTMNEWETVRITASSTDKASVTLTAEDTSVLYLRGSSVTALKAGSTIVTATTKTGSATAKLNVTVKEKAENRPVLSVIGNGNIALGETSKFSASLSGVAAGDYVVQFSVDNPTVASVDAEGKVTALASGKTKLTASTTYRSVQFKAEKDIIVEKEIKVIFTEGAAEAKLAVSALKEGLEGEYAVEINGKTYSVDEEGNVTLLREDFNVAGQHLFDGKITQGENVYTFRIAVFFMEEPAIYQDGEKITPNENGEYVVDKTKPADENGLRWITFDNAETMLDMGYELLKIKVKFNAFCSSSAAIVDSSIGAYHYNFGYKYTEYTDDPAAGEFVWVFWDNDYQGQAYGGAMKPAHHVPYGYGYWKIFDASGNLLLDYYQKQIEDGSGIHGNWSDYIDPLQTDTEYIFLFDISKTHDISFSGFDDAVITGFEWAKKEETVVSFENESISVDEWIETEVNATTNDGSAVEYTVSDPEVLYVSGNKIVGLKAGSAIVIATANGKTAELNVTVNEQAANLPAVEFEGLEIEELGSGSLGATLKVGENTVAAGKYTLEYTAAENDVISIVGGIVAGLKAGEVDVTAKITYCGKEFTKTVKVTVKNAEESVDPSVGKLFQGEEEVAAAEDGSVTPDATNADKTLKFDAYAVKSALGMRRIRFTVKFKAFSANVVQSGYEFGYRYNSTNVLFDNDYVDGMYAGAFAADGSPTEHGYVRIYDNTGALYFEHYNCPNWSSSGFGYVSALALDTEYTFDIDIEKTGDITLYGFENAVFTKIEWVNYNKTEITFNTENVEADEWTEFDFSATTNDLSTLTFTSDNEEILVVKGNKAIGVSTGTANIVARNSAGKTALLPVTITENAAKRPVLTAVPEKTSVEVLEGAVINAQLKIGETVVSASEYTLHAVSDSEAVKFENGKVIGVSEGQAKVTVTATYYEKVFTAQFDITVVAVEDPTKGKLFQNGKEIVANEAGEYKVDTTVEGDADGLHWLTVDTAKTVSYDYLRFTVTFDSFESYKKMTPSQYDYNFGYNYGSVTTFWDNIYSSGGFGGALGADGGANGIYYCNVYTAADNNKILDLMSATGWSPYYTFQTGVEYIFEFNVKAMGESFTLAGFETATIKNITWAEALLG